MRHLLCYVTMPDLAHCTIVGELQDHHQLNYLPRYSPFLNCAERAGSAMKCAAKRTPPDPAVQGELINHNQLAHQMHQTLHGYRLNILRREMTNALQQITQVKCQNWFITLFICPCLRVNCTKRKSYFEHC
jgi:hypothetical protein